MFKSIRGRMIILFTSILCFVSLMPTLFNVLFAESIYINTRTQEMLNIYYDLVSQEKLSAPEIYKKLNVYEDEINLSALILSENGIILYQTFSSHAPVDFTHLFHTNTNEVITNNLIYKPQVEIIGSYRNSSETISVRGVISTDSGVFYVLLESPLSAIQEAVLAINTNVLITTIISFLFGFFVIYYFATKLSKPILEINDVAKNVTNLDFSKKVTQIKTKDELATLGKNINFMSEQLESMIYDLKVANLELKKDNDTHKQIDDMRRDFIASVSHELKTPLSLMQGYTEMLKEDIEGIDKDFYYDVIIDESKHMNELVRRLLDITSLENGLTKLKYEKFNLSEFVTWIISKYTIIADENNLIISQNINENIYVFADKLLIEQAITNFLSNSITYAKENITINLFDTENTIIFEISNDGSVINHDDLDKIWHSFYRTDKARTRSKDKNFGLGLYIVKTIINAHNGNVSVSSKDDIVTFQFELDKDV